MNDLQRVEFELLKTFVQICEKLELKYFLVCGTALGAVKYKGFIPWDDDIDVALLREDYERFIREAPALLPEGLFLQNHKSDPAFPHIYSKLRNSQTTYIESLVSALPINHGVFIDIFPLDGYPENKKEQKRLEQVKKRAWSKQSCRYTYPRHYKRVRLQGFLLRILGCHRRTAAIVARLEKKLIAYPAEHSQVLCNHGNSLSKAEYSPRWHYGQGIQGEFEGLSVTIPENYDAYLTQKYGDWRAQLPEEEQVGHHFFEVCDLCIPYTHYFGKK